MSCQWLQSSRQAVRLQEATGRVLRPLLTRPGAVPQERLSYLLSSVPEHLCLCGGSVVAYRHGSGINPVVLLRTDRTWHWRILTWVTGHRQLATSPPRGKVADSGNGDDEAAARSGQRSLHHFQPFPYPVSRSGRQTHWYRHQQNALGPEPVIIRPLYSLAFVSISATSVHRNHSWVSLLRALRASLLPEWEYIHPDQLFTDYWHFLKFWPYRKLIEFLGANSIFKSRILKHYIFNFLFYAQQVIRIHLLFSAVFESVWTKTVTSI